MVLKFTVKRSQNKINNCLIKDIFYLVIGILDLF